MPPWWGTKQNISTRMRQEFQFMRDRFGDTFRLVHSPLGQIYWIGTVEVNMAGVNPREHTLKIVYPKDYPDRAAEVYVVEPEIRSPKHQFEDGQLCLFNPKDGTNYGWNPTNSLAVTSVIWGIEWLYAYYTYRAGHDWPGTEERVRG